MLSAAKLIKDTLGADIEVLGFFGGVELSKRGTLGRRVRGFGDAGDGDTVRDETTGCQ